MNVCIHCNRKQNVGLVRRLCNICYRGTSIRHHYPRLIAGQVEKKLTLAEMLRQTAELDALIESRRLTMPGRTGEHDLKDLPRVVLQGRGVSLKSRREVW